MKPRGIGALVLVFAALMTLQACSGAMLKQLLPESRESAGAAARADAEAKPSQAYVYVANPHEGSLWTPYNSRSFLFGDNKARTINDIVTIKIMESSDASRNATTKLSRKGEMKSGIGKFFGSPDLTFGMDNLWGKNTDAKTAAGRVEQPFQPELETTTENSFNGDGSTVRKDKFIATISAKVFEVYPNGNMLIKGNREVSINNEKQFIELSGIIRPEDISFDNVVVSTAIADAKISISGKGVIADKQNPGYGHRAFDWVWPF
jgi:flagellar L-ring protein precursor FlgH